MFNFLSKQEEDTLIYKKENVLLNMIAIPYFGVYSPNYTFMVPVNVQHGDKITQSQFDRFPSPLQGTLSEFNKQYNVPIDFFLITFDGSFLYSKYIDSHMNDLLRLNVVHHPYIFYDVKNLDRDHSTFVFTSLFKAPKDYILETQEFDGMRINPNPQNFITDDNKKEIILHKSNDNFPAISPNNCAFLISLHNHIFTVYLTTAVVYKNKIVKLMIAQCNIIMNNECLILSPFLETFYNFTDFQQTEEVIKNFLVQLITNKDNYLSVIKLLFGYFLSESEEKLNKDTKNCIIKIFKILYKKNANIMNNINAPLNNNSDDFSLFLKEESAILYDSPDTDFYYNNICYFIWYCYGCPQIPNFGENILLFNYNDNGMFQKEIILKYIRYMSNTVESFVFSYLYFIKENSKLKINEKDIFVYINNSGEGKKCIYD